MSRTHRLFALLQMLRRHRGPVSGATLAHEAGVSLRTLYRDIAALQAMGAEVEGAPGFGYVLKPGFLLPPLMFSENEIEALALGVKWVARHTDAEMAGAAREALAKLSAVLPADLQHVLDDEALIVGPGCARPQTVSLEFLRRALKLERKLAIRYGDEKGARTKRVIWPVGLGFFETTRVLVAWCELRDGFRHFRADRIEAAEILPERSPKRRRTLLREWRGSLLTNPDRVGTYSSGVSTRRETAMTKELIFYTNPQSRGNTVHWALEEIGCPYTVKVLECGTTMKAPDYLAINPMGKVPAIRHGDAVVTEVSAILFYLADVFPDAGLAPPVDGRADYYRWMFFAAGCLEPAVTNHGNGWDPTPEQQGHCGYGSYEQAVETLAGTLANKACIAGDRFSATDIRLASTLGFFMMFNAIEKRPEFEAYCARHFERPAYKRAQEKIAKLATQKAWEKA